MLVDFNAREQQGWPFHCFIMDSYFVQKQQFKVQTMMDLLLTIMQLVTLQDVLRISSLT